MSYNSSNAYNMNLNNGNINNNNKTNNKYVRCVREHKFTFQEIYKAYETCKKNKRNTINALKYEVNLESNLQELLITLSNKSYVPTRSVCFSVNKPKPREIFAADFKDRIVHHVLFNRLNPVFEKIFIYDSFACRKGKGTLNAVKRVQKFTKKINLPANQAYFLQLDIHNFFMSIDKNILFNILEKKINDKNTLWLTKTLIFHNPTLNFKQKGLTWQQAKVPVHKTLFNTGENKGLPIGNLTSQFFANVYLNKLDRFIKHTLKIKYYVRYVDDFVILSKSRKQLLDYKQKISDFLIKDLNLKLKPLVVLKPISSGINFVGYVIRPNYLLPRNRVVNNFLKKTKVFLENNVCLKENYILYNFENIEKFTSMANSYLGYLKHSKHLRLITNLKTNNSSLETFFIFDKHKVVNKYSNKLSYFYEQFLFFKNNINSDLVFLDVGKYYRFLGNDALVIKAQFPVYKLLTSQNYVYLDVPHSFFEKNYFVLFKNYKKCVFTKKVNFSKPLKREVSFVCVSS